MRMTAGVTVNPCKIPENYVNPISRQRQTNGSRAGLKIRSAQEGVGSSLTFGTEIDYFVSTTRTPLGATTEFVPSTRSASSAAGR